MRYWSFACPDENGDAVVETLSEDEIIEEFYPYWSVKMIEKFGQEEFDKTWSKKECIQDFIVIHWAWESN